MIVDHIPGQEKPLAHPQPSIGRPPSNMEALLAALSTETAATLPDFLYAKRAKVSKLIGLGATLMRELHTAGSSNFDETFPPPFTMSNSGQAYFDVLAVLAWVKSRQAIAANDAAGKSR